MADEASDAVDVAVEFECKKDSCRQQQSGEWSLALKIHPQDVNQELMLAVPGQRYKCFLVALGDDERPLKPEHTPTTNGAVEAKPKRQWRETPRATQAGILCDEPRFQKWIVDKVFSNLEAPDRIYNADEAKYAIYAEFGISSRAELALYHSPELWDDFVSEYRADTQQTAEVR